MNARNRFRIGLGVGALALAAGCSSGGVYSLPLPGGVDVGEHPKQVTITFRNVLDLVPQTAVKVDGVPVGRVTDIAVGDDGWSAKVTVALQDSVQLPGNARASLDQTNLLGEKFIALSAPATGASGALADGAVIPVTSTTEITDIEQVLGAMSLLLNGGGVAQLAPVVHELSTALDGREGTVRDLLEQTETLIAGLNAQRDDITRALDGLDRLSARASAQSDQLARVLDELPTAVGVLEEQRPQFQRMLEQVDRLGEVGADVLTRSKNDLINDLLALRPVLGGLAESGDDLVNSLPFLLTVPFPDDVEKVALGNSVNLFLTVDLQLSSFFSSLGVGYGDPQYVEPKYGPKTTIDPSNPYTNGNGPRPGWPTVSILPILPALPAAPTASPLDAVLEPLGLKPPSAPPAASLPAPGAP